MIFTYIYIYIYIGWDEIWTYDVLRNLIDYCRKIKIWHTTCYIVKYILIFISHFNFIRPSKFQNSTFYHPKNFIFYFLRNQTTHSRRYPKINHLTKHKHINWSNDHFIIPLMNILILQILICSFNREITFSFYLHFYYMHPVLFIIHKLILFPTPIQVWNA